MKYPVQGQALSLEQSWPWDQLELSQEKLVLARKLAAVQTRTPNRYHVALIRPLPAWLWVLCCKSQAWVRQVQVQAKGQGQGPARGAWRVSQGPEHRYCGESVGATRWGRDWGRGQES